MIITDVYSAAVTITVVINISVYSAAVKAVFTVVAPVVVTAVVKVGVTGTVTVREVYRLGYTVT